MKAHWQQDQSLIEEYASLERAALDGTLRPVVFIVATTRKFDLIAFEKSLKNSLNGSNLLLSKELIHLFIGHLYGIKLYPLRRLVKTVEHFSKNTL